MIPKNIKAIFFDMDGVLYDSMPNNEYTWRESFKTVGIDFPPEEAYLNEGRTGFAIIRYAFKKYLNREASEEEQAKVYNIKTQMIQQRPKASILPGMQKLLFDLKQREIDVYVITGSKQESLTSRLQKDFGVDKNYVISGKDVKHGKPHPEPYLIALQRSGLQAKQCMVVENAPLGIQSAKAAAIYTLAVNTGKLNDQILIDAGADQLFTSTKLLAGYLMER